MSLIYQYGLRAKPIDPALAQQYRQSVFEKRGNTLKHYYSSSGSTAQDIPVYDNMTGHVPRADKCAAALDARRTDVEAVHLCHGAPNQHELVELWARAKVE
ncbi:MAG: hypothetical protein QM645_10645 [Asticcacaulis sp.]